MSTLGRQGTMTDSVCGLIGALVSGVNGAKRSLSLSILDAGNGPSRSVAKSLGLEARGSQLPRPQRTKLASLG